MQVSIRDVEKKIFKEFRACAVKEGLTVGKAVTLAMVEWLDKTEGKQNFLDLQPFDWGPGTENTSKEVDSILYGKP